MAEAKDVLTFRIFCHQPPHPSLLRDMLESSNKSGVNTPAISHTQGFGESVKKVCKQYTLIAAVTQLYMSVTGPRAEPSSPSASTLSRTVERASRREETDF